MTIILLIMRMFMAMVTVNNRRVMMLKIILIKTHYAMIILMPLIDKDFQTN